MSELARHVSDYLALRRALGFRLEREGRELPRLVAHLEAAGAATITTELAIEWARLPQGVQPLRWAHRLGSARGFARYLATIDPTTEIPPRDVFGARQRRPTPHLWTDGDVRRLLEAARDLRPPLRAATHEALFGLLAATGMRLGEAIGLEREDVDLAEGLLTVRRTKSRRPRVLPLHPTATAALRAYAERRDGLCPRPRSRTFLVSSVGTALDTGDVERTVARLTTALGLRTASVRPTLHGLRHTFAVETLVAWQRSGDDAAARMATLSTYLGHVDPAGTYWYLSATPELMGLAAERLDGRFGGRS